jgi:hypothetical protein
VVQRIVFDRVQTTLIDRNKALGLTVRFCTQQQSSISIACSSDSEPAAAAPPRLRGCRNSERSGNATDHSWRGVSVRESAGGRL